MSSDRSAVGQGVKFEFEAMQAGAQIANTRKEQEMNEAKLGWFDRLLIKIALAKSAARGHLHIGLAQRLKSDFSATRDS
jgi:hypothetical protein